MPLVHKTILLSPTNLVENGPTTKQINLKTQLTTHREIENQSSQPKEFEVKNPEHHRLANSKTDAHFQERLNFSAKAKEEAKTEKRISLIQKMFKTG
jgi:hypothetical protein